MCKKQVKFGKKTLGLIQGFSCEYQFSSIAQSCLTLSD